MKRTMISITAALLAVLTLVSCVGQTGRDASDGTSEKQTSDPTVTTGKNDPDVTTGEDQNDPKTTTGEDNEDSQVTTGEGGTRPSHGGEIRRSGSFMSENEDSIKLYIEWESVAPTDSNVADVTVKVYLQSYTLTVGERKDGRITFGDTEVKYSTPAISITEKTLTRTLLTEQTLTSVTSFDGECELKVSWHFNGSYTGVKIDYITATETIKTK